MQEDEIMKLDQFSNIKYERGRYKASAHVI